MSLIMSIYLNDGVVMASDSRITITTKTESEGATLINSFPFSDSTFKTFVAPNQCGISTCGASSYKNKPISGYIEKFLLSEIKEKTTVKELADKIADYFTNLDDNNITIFHVCGYTISQGNEYQLELYRCLTGKNKNVELIDTSSQGACWDGVVDTLKKLIHPSICNPSIIGEIQYKKNDEETIDSIVISKADLEYYSQSDIPWNLMTIAEAVDFINFAFTTTINDMKFKSVSKTVGGPINILAIKPSGPEWIKKNSYKD